MTGLSAGPASSWPPRSPVLRKTGLRVGQELAGPAERPVMAPTQPCFNAPPGWSVPPDEDWVPPTGWEPKPWWPPAPEGWAFWTSRSSAEGPAVVAVPVEASPTTSEAPPTPAALPRRPRSAAGLRALRDPY